MRHLRSLCSHALLILAKFKSKSQLVHNTKVKLNILQLTLAKLAQLRKAEVPDSIPTGGNFSAEFIFLFPTLAFIANIANFAYLWKK